MKTFKSLFCNVIITVKKRLGQMPVPPQTPHAEMPKLSQTRVRICKKVPCQMRHYYL